ncbi:MAG: CPBP family intramembrane metalloprotease [Actinomycetales bacterium]|nr:CPBP family intramembrane metalloprotease [Actinomycetales bacterium]
MDNAPDVDRSVRPGAVLVAAVAGFVIGELFASALVGTAATLAHYPGGFAGLAAARENPWWASSLSLVGLWVGFIVAIVAATRVGGLRPWPHQWRFTLGDLWFVALGVGAQIVVGVLYRPFHLRHLNAPVDKLFGAAHGAGFVLLVVLTTFGAPIVEEWFFRGVVFRGIAALAAPRSPRLAVAIAVVLSALIFAGVHGEARQFAGLAGLGVVLAIVAWRTKRLLPSTLTHVSFNAVAMASVIAHRVH